MSKSGSPVVQESSAAGDQAQPDPASLVDDPSAIKESLLRSFSALPRRALTVCLVMDALFIALYVSGLAFALHSHTLFFLMDLNAEGNPPTWWYGTQQLLVAITFLLLASKLFVGDARVRAIRPAFLAAGIGFLFISADEVGELHEYGSRLLQKSDTVHDVEDSVMRALHISHHLNGGGTWIVVYALIGIALLAWVIPYAFKAYKLWPKQLITVIVGFGVFAFSAAVIQVIGYFLPMGTTAHYVYVLIEQTLKMIGISIALYGAVQVLADCAERLTRALAHEEDAQPELSKAD